MVNRATEEETIRTLDADWLRAVGAHDVNRVMTVYAPDAVVMTPNSPAATGSGIRKGWSELFGLPSESLVWTPSRVEVSSSGDLANEIGTYRLSYDSPNGKVNDNGNFTTVWRKIGGQWKVATDAVISSSPMPTAAASMMSSEAAMADVTDMEMRASKAIVWADLVTPGFAPGTKIAVIHGDPSKKGDYTLRLQFPDGYEFPVHWHPGGEHLTVLSGSFHLGMGGAANPSAAQNYGPGDFLYIPPRMSHFGGARGVTVIQLHGNGPFAINLGTPK